MSGFGGAVKLTGESEYRRALKQISQNLKEVTSEMKVVTTAFNSNDNSIQALSAKEDVLNKKLGEQTKKLQILQAEYASIGKTYSEESEKHNKLTEAYNQEERKLKAIERTLGTSTEEYQEQQKKVAELEKELTKSASAQDTNSISMSKMRTEINKAQADCNKTARELEQLGEKSEESGEKAKRAGDGFTVFKGILVNLATQAINAAVNGLKKLGSAFVNIMKQSVSSYSSYEQLVGGVETLFGKSSSKLVKYANNAYKTAGISANEYMEQATSFSATLLQGLKGDTEAAVKYADMAIIDMSDNANKMGTDMVSIQNAYQGFAKDNYTMLDNLKLGYGGTAGEMARLINDSGVLGDSIKVTAKTVKDVPFDQMIQAIHVIQQEIGITGTTTEEAASTIEGSTKSMAAAWKNLLTGMADENADLDGLIKNLVDNVVIYAKNIVPRIKQAVSGFGDVISALADQVDVILDDELLDTVSDVLNNIVQMVVKIMPKILEVVGKAIQTLVKNVAQAIPEIISNFDSAAAAAMLMIPAIAGVIKAVKGLGISLEAIKASGKKMLAFIAANPVAAAVTAAVVGLTVAIAALHDKWKKSHQAASPYYETLERLKKTNDELSESIGRTKENLQDSMEKTEASVSAADGLKDKLSELMAVEDKDAATKDKIAAVVNALNQAVPNLGLAYDAATDSLNMSNSAIERNIRLMEQQLKQEAYRTGWLESLEDQAKAEKSLAEAKQTVADMTKNFTDAEREALAQQAANGKIYENNMLWLKMQEGAFGDQLYTIDELKTAFQELSDAENICSEAAKSAAWYSSQYDESLDTQAEAATKTGESAKEMGAAIKDAGDEAAEAYNQMVEAAQESVDSQIGLFEKLETGSKASLEEMNAALESQYEAISNYSDNLNAAMEYVKESGDTNAAAFVQAIADMGIDGAGELAAFVEAIHSDTDEASKMIANFAKVEAGKTELAKSIADFKTMANEMMSGMEHEVTNGKSKVTSAMNDVMGAAKSAVNSYVGTFQSVGANLTQGIVSGVLSQASSAASAMGSVISGMVQEAVNRAQIKSPSRVMRDKVGKNLALGVIQGVKGQQKNAKKSAEELTKVYVSAARTRASELRKTNKLTEAAEISYWQTIRKHTKKGTDAYKSATAQISAAKKNLQKDVTSVSKSFAKEIKKVDADLQESIKSLNDAYEETVKSRKEAITGSLDIFSKESTKLEAAFKKESYTEIIKRQVDNLKEWGNTLTSLEKKFSNGELIDEFRGMGVDQLNVLKQFDSMTESEIAEYQKLYKEREALANSRAAKENETLKAETEKQVKDLQKTAQKQIAALKKSYLKEMKKLGVDGKKQGKDAGKQIAAGINAGFKDQMKSVNKEVKAQMQEMLKAIKKQLKIKSPSQVFRDEVGDMIAKGIGVGFVDEMKEVTRQMNEAVPTTLDAKTAVRTSLAAERQEAVSGTAGEGRIIVENRFYLGEKDITDMLAKKIIRKIDTINRNTQISKGKLSYV